MLRPLPPDRFACLLPLVHSDHLELVLEAVVAGNAPGLVWADDDAAPSGFLVWDKAYNVYVGSSPEVAAPDASRRSAFGPAAARLLATELVPVMQRRRQDIFLLTSDDDAPAAMLDGLAELERRAVERAFYRRRPAPAPPWRDRVPADCSVRRIDAELLARQDLPNVQRLLDEIELCWNSASAFLEVGFGFCLLHEDTLVSWCTGEYFSVGKCGIGIETVESHQRRGYATLTASAFVDHCLAEGRTAHWDSWAANEPSIRTAEKLGFELVERYSTLVFDLPTA